MSNHLQDQILASIQDTLIASAIVAPDCVHLEGVDELPLDATPALRIDAGPEMIETGTRTCAPC